MGCPCSGYPGSEKKPRDDTSVAISQDDKKYLEGEAKSSGNSVKEELHNILEEWRKKP